jgi:hypothetical protein
MPKFKVIATMYTYLSMEVEAEDIDKAWEIAKCADGSEFEASIEGGFSLDDIYEVDE